MERNGKKKHTLCLGTNKLHGSKLSSKDRMLLHCMIDCLRMTRDRYDDSDVETYSGRVQMRGQEFNHGIKDPVTRSALEQNENSFGT